jgi:hypothetical protein
MCVQPMDIQSFQTAVLKMHFYKYDDRVSTFALQQHIRKLTYLKIQPAILRYIPVQRLVIPPF